MSDGDLHELLLRACMVFQNGADTYRDACLAAGRLLREYVLEVVRRGDGQSEDRRVSTGSTREAATLVAAEQLGVKTSRITALIRLAAAVDVLSDHGDVGQLSYAALRALTPLVENRLGQVARGRTPAAGTCLPSEGLAWYPKQIEGYLAVDIFRQAVVEAWGSKRIEAHLYSLHFPRRGGRKPLPPRALETVKRGTDDDYVRGYRNPNDTGNGRGPAREQADLRTITSRGCPKDVAELVMGMVEQSSDPVAVLDLLETQMQALRRRVRQAALVAC